MAKCHRHSCIKDYAVSSLTYIPDLTFVETRRNSYLQTESFQSTCPFGTFFAVCRCLHPYLACFIGGKFSLGSQNSKSNGNCSVLSTRRRFLISYRLTRCFSRISSSTRWQWSLRLRCNFLNKDGQASFMSDVILYKRKFRGSLCHIFEGNRILLALIYTWVKKLGKLAKMIKVIGMQGYACRSNCLSFIMHRVT